MVLGIGFILIPPAGWRITDRCSEMKGREEEANSLYIYGVGGIVGSGPCGRQGFLARLGHEGQVSAGECIIDVDKVWSMHASLMAPTATVTSPLHLNQGTGLEHEYSSANRSSDGVCFAIGMRGYRARLLCPGMPIADSQ